jgi:DnaJ-domain-containing protein 1
MDARWCVRNHPKQVGIDRRRCPHSCSRHTLDLKQDTYSRLHALILDILRAKPNGLSEYELLQELARADPQEFCVNFHDSLALFRAHFLLFHALYALRECLWHEHQGHLEISPMEIVLREYHASESETLAVADPLRDYYMDFGNLEKMGIGELDDILGRFWARLQASGQRHLALQVLELQEPVDYETIRSQYRRLAMRHHPDRGGDKERLQQINEAMALLAKAHGK